MYRTLFCVAVGLAIAFAEQPPLSAQVIGIYNDYQQPFTIKITTTNGSDTSFATVNESETANLTYNRRSRYDMEFKPTKGNPSYAYDVDLGRYDRVIDLSYAITEVDGITTRDGSPIYQVMTQNGFRPRQRDQALLDSLKRSSWNVTYQWGGRQGQSVLYLDGNKGQADGRRLSDVQYIASDKLYVVGKWRGAYNGIFILEIPRSRQDRFWGDGTGHNDWFEFSGRKLR